MMQRTDRHFRYLMRLIAPRAWLYTEMVSTGALLQGRPERFLRFDATEHPVALQLGGCDPRALEAAARLGADAGFDEINLNVGCPSGRVRQAEFGAALMLDGPRVAECVSAMRAAVPVPVTVKTRLGVDEHDSYDFLRVFIEMLAATGCRTLILHARKAWLQGLSPKQNREIPPLDYARVHRLKRAFPDLEIVVNGGLADTAGVLEQLEHVDGVMLGRAAYRRPMLMAELDRKVFGTHGALTPEVVARRYVPYLSREVGRGQSLKLMTRHLLGLYAHRPGGRRWRRALGELPEGIDGVHALADLVDSRDTDELAA